MIVFFYSKSRTTYTEIKAKTKGRDELLMRDIKYDSSDNLTLNDTASHLKAQLPLNNKKIHTVISPSLIKKSD